MQYAKRKEGVRFQHAIGRARQNICFADRLGGVRTRTRCHASSLLNTIEALVPPKPNELDKTQPSATLSRRSRTIGISAISGSSVSILALSQIKLFFIISSE